MEPSTCPEPEALAAFLAGNLAGTMLEAIAGHVDVCPKCQGVANAGGLPTGSLPAALRGPGPADPFLAEPGCAAAVARFQEVPAPGEADPPPGDLGPPPLEACAG